jgi:biofilm PGA synthesis protein PgaA
MSFSFNISASLILNDADFKSAKILFKNKQYLKALVQINRHLSIRPNDIDGRAFKAETLHILKQHTEALNLYQEILRERPKWKYIQVQYVHLLIDLGALTPAQKLIEKYSLQEDLDQRFYGNQAVKYIKWNDSEEAEKLLLKNSHSQDSMLKQRAKFDLIMLYRKKLLMNKVLQEKQLLDELDKEFPFWLQEAEADALVASKKPEDALLIYRELESKHQLYAKDYPQSFNLQMSIFACFIDMEHFEEAFGVLEDINSYIGGLREERGLLVNNYHWVSIRLNYAWWYMYQGRFEEAESIIEDLHDLMPANDMVQFSRAYLSLWRGHPTKALESFSIIKHGNHINSLQTQNGINMALDNLGFKREARAHTDELLSYYPESILLNTQKENQSVDDMNIFKFETSLEDFYRLSLSAPVDWFDREVGIDRIFIEHAWWKKGNDYYNSRSNSQSSITEGKDRFFEKFGWRGLYVPGIEGELYLSYFNHDKVGFGSHMEAGTDYWFLAAGYDSISEKVPLINELQGNESYVQVKYRQDETFDVALKMEYIAQNDGNHRSSYSLRSHNLIKVYHRWQFNIDTDLAYIDRKKEQSELYYSPNDYVLGYVIPNVSHLWYRRYDYSFSDRLYFGLGYKEERNYEGGEVSFIRYQQELNVNKKLKFLWSMTWDNSIFYGDKEDNIGAYFEMEWRF